MYRYQQLPPLPNHLTREERESMIGYLVDCWELKPDRIWALYGLQKHEVKRHELGDQLELQFNQPKPN